ncbi:MAG: DSD1 family PLP-dependent enzyme [Betaproteobacteria bacterium]|nr:DSD1 family PLP-dependent enzyme [Betaproteobacteria bacterium]
MQRSAAQIGDVLANIDTPALILDQSAFERNGAALMAAVSGLPIRVRPHAKSHKCPEIARRQVAAGAVGICCQKVSEAEAFVEAGIQNILISNQVVGEKKITRLIAMAQRADLSVCVDHIENARALSAAASAAGLRLGVLIELEVGAMRCGVAPGESALALAREISQMPGLEFLGLQSYHGPAQHLRTHSERRAAIDQAITLTRSTRDLLAKHGMPCRQITGAGTGSFMLEASSHLYTEIQPGSYIFMDADYSRNDWRESGMPIFEQSLFVLASVMSLRDPDHAVVDAGLKASSVDSGMPIVADLTDVRYHKASDEHGVLQRGPRAEKMLLGQKIRLIPGHCDPTVNLYDELIVVREGRVTDIWPILARGALL